MNGTRTAGHQRRSAARLAAVQALYALDVSGGTPDRIIADLFDRRWSNADSAAVEAIPDEVYLRTLVEGVIERRTDLDRMIGGALTQNWTMERLEILLQAILRAGAFELLVQDTVPPKVVINEYLDIAHAFYSGKEPSLVNAVLDRVATRVRAGATTPLDESDVG